MSNPTPRIPLPDWLSRRGKDLDTSLKQQTITSIFKPVDYSIAKFQDIEDIKPPPPMIPNLIEIKNPPNFYNDFQN